MSDMDIEIFATGTVRGHTFTTSDLDTLARNFATLQAAGYHSVPVKLGHSDAQIVAGQSDGDPALGWVSNLRRAGNKLVATISGMPTVLRELIEKGRYKKVSSEIYTDFSRTDAGKSFGETVKGMTLSAVAFLGADIPAVRSLKDLGTLLATERPLMLSEPAKDAVVVTFSAGHQPGTKANYSAFLAAVESKIQELKLSRIKDAERRRAMHLVLGEHPELHPGPEGIRACLNPDATSFRESTHKADLAKLEALMDRADKVVEGWKAMREDVQKGDRHPVPDPTAQARVQDALLLRELEDLSGDKATALTLDGKNRALAELKLSARHEPSQPILLAEAASTFSWSLRDVERELHAELGAEGVKLFTDLAKRHKLNLARRSDYNYCKRLVAMQQGFTVATAKSFGQAVLADIVQRGATFHASEVRHSTVRVLEQRPELTDAAQAKARLVADREARAAELARFAEGQRSIEDRIDDALIASGRENTPQERQRIRGLLMAKEVRRNPRKYGSAGIVPSDDNAPDVVALAFSEALKRHGYEDTARNRAAAGAEVWKTLNEESK